MFILLLIVVTVLVLHLYFHFSHSLFCKQFRFSFSFDGVFAVVVFLKTNKMNTKLSEQWEPYVALQAASTDWLHGLAETKSSKLS